MASPVVPISDDPRKQQNANLGYIYGQGQQLQNQSQTQAAIDQSRTQQYTDYLNPLLFNDAEGGGGYTPEEQQNILQLQNTPGAMTEAQAQQNYLTPDEQSAIQGNTNYYRPDYLASVQGEGQSNQRGAAANMAAGVKGSVDPNALRMSSDYTKNTSAALEGGGTAIAGGLSDQASRVRGAIDPTQLRQSSTAATRENMTPEEEQNIVTSAGISAGLKDQAAVDALQRQALAAGSSPMGVAAYRARMARSQAEDAGNAMTQARVAAQAARAGQALSSEQQRLGAQQNLTGTQVGAEETLGQETTQAQQTQQQRELAATQAIENTRQGAEQYLTGAQMQAATTAGQAQLGTEANIAQSANQSAQFQEQAGQQAENTQAQRAAQIAGNRQQTGMYNQATQYGQGMNTSNALSGRYTGVAGTRLGQQNVARGQLQGQQQMYNQNQQNEYQRQAGLYGTTAGAANQATGQQTGYDISKMQQPSWWQKATGAVAGAAGAMGIERGGVIDKPTVATIGENGPEAVVPIGYRARMAQAGRKITPPRRVGRRVYGEAA